MAALTGFLYEQRNKDVQLAAYLTLLDLANLVAALEHLAAAGPADGVVLFATSLERLLANLARPKTLAHVVTVRREAEGDLGDWSHARVLAEHAAVQRLLEQGRFPQAVTAARALLVNAENGGEDAYDEAAYDIAMADATLGSALRKSGDSESALIELQKALIGFQTLADAGNEDAARMASITIAERGTCLLELGRLDDAAMAFEDSVKWAEKHDDPRQVAVGKGQLGSVRMGQRRFKEALAAHAAARDIFEKLGEARYVGTALHQIGIVHSIAAQYDAAEKAFLEAMHIWVRTEDRAREAGSLNELGNLYDAMGRYEESARFYRQAADIFVELQDLAKEGHARSNLANVLIKIERYDEARDALRRAIECKDRFGHAAQPWKTWAILCNLERAVGDADAAAAARHKAVDAYLAYRRAGGESQTTGAQLCTATTRAIAEDKADQLRAELARFLERPGLPAPLKAFIPILQAILNGSRDPALVDDPNLDFDDAVEVRLLLDTLAGRA